MVSAWRNEPKEDTPSNRKDKAAHADGNDDDDEDEGFVGLCKRKIVLFKSEESLRKKRALTRGTASLQQVEGLHVLSSASLSLPERPGKHYGGTNKGFQYEAMGTNSAAAPAQDLCKLLTGKR